MPLPQRDGVQAGFLDLLLPEPPDFTPAPHRAISPASGSPSVGNGPAGHSAAGNGSIVPSRRGDHRGPAEDPRSGPQRISGGSRLPFGEARLQPGPAGVGLRIRGALHPGPCDDEDPDRAGLRLTGAPIACPLTNSRFTASKYRKAAGNKAEPPPIMYPSKPCQR